NGVASGDTNQNSTVLWTRSNNLGQVLFEYSTDPNFTTIVGSAAANVTDPNLPVKVNIANLTPATTYYYRATDAAGTTDKGQFRTSAPIGSQNGLRFGVAGDWRGDLLPYPAISNVPARNLEFFVQHGDTVYVDIPSNAVLNPDGTRKQQAETIEEYRAKHNEVYSGSRFGVNNWAKLRSNTSILATIDDHEVINDFSGGENAANDPRFPETQGLVNDTVLFENGLQAFQEYNPLRDEFYNTTDPRTSGERKLYRYSFYG
uniref:alkaline phosphatase D family protein n=1 Tax=Anaplasma marginale TaxID=770 RepID=UPI0018E9E05C